MEQDAGSRKFDQAAHDLTKWRELWRERKGDYYADSISVSPEGAFRISCGGRVTMFPSLRALQQAALFR